MTEDPGHLTVEHFAGREGETFTLRGKDLALELELAAVTGQPEEWGRTDRREPFTLTFHGPPEPIVAQRTYHVEHEELGALAIFLVPIEPVEGRSRYEAVFS